MLLGLLALAGCVRPAPVPAHTIGRVNAEATALSATVQAQQATIATLEAELTVLLQLALNGATITPTALPTPEPPPSLAKVTPTAAAPETPATSLPPAAGSGPPGGNTTPPLPTATAASAPPGGPPADWQLTAAVQRIIDGTTIEVDIGGVLWPVRYIGIAAPAAGEPCAAEAAAANAALVAGQTVRLTRDISQTDGAGRLLRYVYLADTFVNGELVAAGWAVPAAMPPDTMMQPLLEVLAAGAPPPVCLPAESAPAVPQP